MVGAGRVPAAPVQSRPSEGKPPKKYRHTEDRKKKDQEDQHNILWSVSDPVSVSLYLVVVFYIILYIDSITRINYSLSDRLNFIRSIQAACRSCPLVNGLNRS